MGIATVYRCVTLLSDAVAVLPLKVSTRRGDVFVTDDRDPLNYLLDIEPDAATSAYDLKSRMVQMLLLDGNAYLVPLYSRETLDVERLVLCGRGTVSHDTETDTYHVADAVNGVAGTFREDEIIHLKGLTMPHNSKRGVSVLEFARLTLSIAATGDNETRNRFANGGNVRGIVTNEKGQRAFNEYAPDELQRTATNLDERFSSGERIVSIPGQAEFHQISMSSTDMQFLESRKFTVRELCRFFGVHPSFVFDDTSNNYKSAEQANVAFLSHTLNPLLCKIENEFQRKLIGRQRSQRRRIRFDRSGLYACDLEAKARYESSLLGMGRTVNELRAMNNLPAVPEGDTVMVSANLRRIDEITQQPTKNTPTNDTQPDTEASDDPVC